MKAGEAAAVRKAHDGSGLSQGGNRAADLRVARPLWGRLNALATAIGGRCWGASSKACPRRGELELNQTEKTKKKWGGGVVCGGGGGI